MSFLKELKTKMLENNPELNINSDRYIISSLVTATRFSQGLSETELASKVSISIDKMYSIEEGEIELSDEDYQKVLNALHISYEEIKEVLKSNKI